MTRSSVIAHGVSAEKVKHSVRINNEVILNLEETVEDEIITIDDEYDIPNTDEEGWIHVEGIQDLGDEEGFL